MPADRARRQEGRARRGRRRARPEAHDRAQRWPVTALTFIALLDDIARFDSADKLQSYLGLVPREYSSGEKQQRGHITKTGSRRMRSLLVECAWGILRRLNPRTEALGNWPCALRHDEASASPRSPSRESSPASCSQ
ncbi:MAG TPA: IS110 family transposase [Polyangiales bacterium]